MVVCGAVRIGVGQCTVMWLIRPVVKPGIAFVWCACGVVGVVW